MMRDGQKFGYDGKSVQRTKTVFNLPDKIKPGKKIFTSSLTDIFHKDIDSFRSDAYIVMRRNPDKIYQFLTKRWERMEKCLPEDWGDGWPNVWLGASAGSQKRYDEMMPYLSAVKAKVKWVSLEPLHAPIDDMGLMSRNKGVLNWVVVGGESGNDNGKYKYRPCELEWLENIVGQCKEAKIPVFVKQLGTHLYKELQLSNRAGAIKKEWPKNLRVQQFPKTKFK